MSQDMLPLDFQAVIFRWDRLPEILRDSRTLFAPAFITALHLPAPQVVQEPSFFDEEGERWDGLS